MSEPIKCVCGQAYFDAECFMAHYQKCQQPARLESDLCTALAKVAEMESVLGSAWSSHCLEAVEWTDKAKEVLSRSDSAPWLLRKQAEAVEAALPQAIKESDIGAHLDAVEDYANYLRRQADELEKLESAR